MPEEELGVKPSFKLKIIFGLLVAMTTLTIYWIMTTSLQTPFYISKMVKMNVSYFLPQGWAFFTRDAREEKLLVYRRKSDGTLTPLVPPGGSYIYFFGLNREGRKVPLEYSYILKNVDSLAWISIDYDLSNISRDSKNAPIIKITNRSYKANTCGEIIFVRTHTIPWAWSNYPSVKMPSKYVRFFVNCKTR